MPTYLSLDFSTPTPGTLADKNSVGKGFTSVQAKSLPCALSHTSASTFVMDGQIIVAGGMVADGSDVNQVISDDPLANSGRNLSPLPFPRSSGVAGRIGENFFFAAGAPGFSGTTFKGVLVKATQQALDCIDVGSNSDAPLYQTFRGKIADNSTAMRSRVSFNLPLGTPRKVDIRLHFAEIYYGAPGRTVGGTDQRIFDVSAAGNTVLDNFDIFAAAGGALKAITVPISGIQVNDDTLNLQFKAEKDFASIAAIEVLSATG